MSPIPAARSTFKQFTVGLNGIGDNIALRFFKLNPYSGGDGDKEEKDRLIEMLISKKMVNIDHLKTSYKYAYKNWIKMQQQRKNSCSFEIEATTKLLLGTGNDSAWEFGLNLNWPWGVPYISGSTLKGLVSSYLQKYGNEEYYRNDKTGEKSELQVELFGGVVKGDKQKTAYSGSVIFNDAWVMLDKDLQFREDIINTHHQQYYSGNRLPDGTENPIPIKFVALSAGAKFFVSIEGSQEATAFIKDILAKALQAEGLGGKTAIGYGRFDVVESTEEKTNRLRDELKTADIKTLLDSFHTYKNITDLHPLFRELMNNIKLDELNSDDNKREIKDMIRSIDPLKYIMEKIRIGEITSLADMSKKKLKTENRIIRNLKEELDTPLNKTETGQELFNIILKKIKPNQDEIKENWLTREIAYGWEDMGLNDDSLTAIIDNKEHQWPPKEDLKAYLDSSPKNINDLEFLKEYLKESMDL